MADASAFDWKKLVGTLAPAVASAFGTPALGIGVTMLSNAIFGKPDASSDDVAKAIAGGELNGDQIAAIRAADNDFQVKMKSLDIDLAKLSVDSDGAYLKDVQDARDMQKVTHSMVPPMLAGGITVGFFGVLIGMMSGHLTTDDNQALLLMLGSLGTAWTGIVMYYFGSSAGSARKDELAAGAPPVGAVKKAK